MIQFATVAASRRRCLHDIARFALTVALAALPLSLPDRVAAVVAPPQSRPNIVIILADDLGWQDVSYHGAPFATPHIDALVASGVALNRFYSCPICSPTRSGLMTGRWPIRFGLMRSVIPPWRDFGLPTAERTLAEALADHGYQSRGVIGKWHLGHLRVKWLPLNQGFTYFYGHYNGALDYFTHKREGEIDWHRNEQTIDAQGYSTDLLAAEAVEFIAEHAAKEDPFFLYVPFNAPHGPLEPPHGSLQNEREKFQGIERKRRRKLAAMVTALDRGIGKIIAAIDQAGATNNTIVWFLSDNGGRHPQSSNQPLRGQKGTVYEGGVRVPAAVTWPGHLPAGVRREQVVGYIDVMPTLLAIAQEAKVHIEKEPHFNGTAAQQRPFDGVNIWPALKNGEQLPARTWYHFIRQGGRRSEKIAVLDDGWKLVAHGDSILNHGESNRLQIELFHLAEDLLEQHNLAAEHPDQVQRLRKLAVAFRKLQFEHHLPAYGKGRKRFEAPPGWDIRAWKKR